jgi:PB1 domain
MQAIIVRIKHDGKARRVAQPLQTIEDLKKKVTELYGLEAKNIHIVYKDCEDELVSVLDNDDLQNCYLEAKDLGATSVTFIVKSKAVASRSVSSKKSSSESERSSSEEFEKVPAEAQKKPTQEELTAQANAIREKIEAESRLLKEKLQKEHEAKLAEIESNKAKVIEKVEKQRASSSSQEEQLRHKAMGGQHVIKNYLKHFKFMLKTSAENSLGLVKVLNEVVKTVNEQCPALKFNPKLIAEIINQSKGPLIQQVKTTYEQIIAAKPELAKLGEGNKAKWEDFKEKHSCWAEKADGHRGPRGQGSKPRKTSEERRAARELRQKEKGEGKWGKHGEEFNAERAAAKQAERQKRHEERDRVRAEKEAAQQAKHAEREAKQAEKEAKQAERQTKDAEKEFKLKVRAIRDLLPKVDKHQIKAFVAQNMNCTLEQAVETLKTMKKPKSSFR